MKDTEAQVDGEKILASIKQNLTLIGVDSRETSDEDWSEIVQTIQDQIDILKKDEKYSNDAAIEQTLLNAAKGYRGVVRK